MRVLRVQINLSDLIQRVKPMILYQNRRVVRYRIIPKRITTLELYRIQYFTLLYYRNNKIVSSIVHLTLIFILILKYTSKNRNRRLFFAPKNIELLVLLLCIIAHCKFINMSSNLKSISVYFLVPCVFDYLFLYLFF